MHLPMAKGKTTVVPVPTATAIKAVRNAGASGRARAKKCWNVLRVGREEGAASIEEAAELGADAGVVAVVDAGGGVVARLRAASIATLVGGRR